MKEHIPFWTRVKQLLKEQKLSFDAFGESVGIAGSTMRVWMNRDNYPNAEEAFKIAKALNVTVEYLMTGESDNDKLLDSDIREVISNLQLIDQNKRRPIIAFVKTQVEFWKKI